uniref:Uncharacterized protein n=1 Tax=Arundo donax TaxID=35708 RepID=A0A0A8ZQW0_ARUDO
MQDFEMLRNQIIKLVGGSSIQDIESS